MTDVKRYFAIKWEAHLPQEIYNIDDTMFDDKDEQMVVENFIRYCEDNDAWYGQYVKDGAVVAEYNSPSEEGVL